MKYNEFEVKIDGVQIKVNDKYILINSTIEIMLNQIIEVMINEPDWLGVGKFELKLANAELDFNHIFYFKSREEFEDVLKLKKYIEYVLKNKGQRILYPLSFSFFSLLSIRVTVRVLALPSPAVLTHFFNASFSFPTEFFKCFAWV